MVRVVCVFVSYTPRKERQQEGRRRRHIRLKRLHTVHALCTQCTHTVHVHSAHTQCTHFAHPPAEYKGDYCDHMSEAELRAHHKGIIDPILNDPRVRLHSRDAKIEATLQICHGTTATDMSWYDSYRYVIMVRQLQICHGTTATDMSSWYDSYRYVIMVRQLQICHGTTATDMSSWYDSSWHLLCNPALFVPHACMFSKPRLLLVLLCFVFVMGIGFAACALFLVPL